MLGAPRFMNAGLHIVTEGWLLVLAVVCSQQNTFPP